MSGSPAHQLFLQTMMSEGALNEAETKRLHSSVLSATKRPPENASLTEFLVTLNRQLKPLDLEVVSSRLEDSYERWYGLVNREADPAARIASGYSAAELEFFNKVMEILATNNGIASSTALINASCTLERKLTGSGAQSFLKKLVKNNWLSEVSSGKFGPGARFILELRPFLSDIFKEDIVMCKTCKDPVIRGAGCGNEDCTVKLHLLCIARLAQGTCRDSFKCPGCHDDWTSEVPKIELPEQQEPEDSISTSGPGPSTSRTRRAGRR